MCNAKQELRDETERFGNVREGVCAAQPARQEKMRSEASTTNGERWGGIGCRLTREDAGQGRPAYNGDWLAA